MLFAFNILYSKTLFVPFVDTSIQDICKLATVDGLLRSLVVVKDDVGSKMLAIKYKKFDLIQTFI